MLLPVKWTVSRVVVCPVQAIVSGVSAVGQSWDNARMESARPELPESGTFSGLHLARWRRQ
jgi:hypothetical protein